MRNEVPLLHPKPAVFQHEQTRGAAYYQEQLQVLDFSRTYIIIQDFRHSVFYSACPFTMYVSVASSINFS
jgi:hypothetical protein